MGVGWAIGWRRHDHLVLVLSDLCVASAPGSLCSGTKGEALRPALVLPGEGGPKEGQEPTLPALSVCLGEDWLPGRVQQMEGRPGHSGVAGSCLSPRTRPRPEESGAEGTGAVTE